MENEAKVLYLNQILAGTHALDPECVDLCVAINKLPKIQTFESCCGHGNTPYRIYFAAKSLKSLPALLYWFDGCHCGFYGWKVYAHTDCGMSPVSFIIEGPVGSEAFVQSKEIARLIEAYINGSDKP